MRRLGLVVIFLLCFYGGWRIIGQESIQPSTSPVATVPGTLVPAAPNAPSQVAVVTTTVPSPASPQHVPEQIEYGLAVSLALSYLTKKRWFAFLTPESTSRVKAIVGFIAAFLTAAGIHYSVSGNFLDGSGTFTITGLSLNAVKDVVGQWVAQQAWYIGLVKDKGVA